MCRLAYIRRPFDGMSKWLADMEESCGGDGNGVAIGTQVMKGVDVSVPLTVKFSIQVNERRRRSKRAMLPTLWHTRRTSSGGDHDDLCHPFECDNGWLVHNGHWHWAANEARGMRTQPMSDTRLFSLICERHGFEKAVAEYQPPGVWLHMDYDGDLRVYKSGGSLVHCRELGSLGSEPASVGTWVWVEDGFHASGEVRTAERSVIRLGEWYDSCGIP